MPVALIAKDKPDLLSVRTETRPDRVAYLKSHDSVEQAGAILDDAGAMCGSLIVLNVADMAEAEAFVEGDPYGKAGLFDRVDQVSWNLGIGG